MKKILRLVFIGIFVSSNLFGQIDIEFKHILERKDFNAFKKKADSLSIKAKYCEFNWEFLRDLTGDFKEGVFTFKKININSINPLLNTTDTFHVSLISSKAIIIYYKIEIIKGKKINNVWENNLQTVVSFVDKQLYDSLRLSFRKIFEVELDSNDLFLKRFEYGNSCGFLGTVQPFGRKKLNEWMRQKNKQEILNWLKSANTEKQFYAIEGLLRLRKEGFILTEFEKTIIKFIIKKEGTIQTCNGCTFGTEPIKSYKKFFKL